MTATQRCPLAVLIDTQADTITICGVTYPAELFRRGPTPAEAEAAMQTLRRVVLAAQVTTMRGGHGFKPAPTAAPPSQRPVIPQPKPHMEPYTASRLRWICGGVAAVFFVSMVVIALVVAFKR